MQAANGHAPCDRSFPAEGDAFRNWLRWRTPWGLTQRECDVVYWLCQGKTNSEIGRILGIAERTAETHALHIYPKMGVENRYTAIATLNRLTSFDNDPNISPGVARPSALRGMN